MCQPLWSVIPVMMNEVRAVGAWSVALLIVALTAGMGGCDSGGSAKAQDVVVVYTSLDREYSEPILRQFEEQTGIKVKPVYDVESAKTTGLVNRLIAQRDHPDCDVFWNNEAMQTMALAEMGLFEPYESANAPRIPAAHRDEQHRWVGFAARLRVIIYNTQRFTPATAPSSLRDFVDPQYRGDAAIANPFFGTTFTHMAALEGQMGSGELETWLRAVQANDVRIAPGNGPVRDLVAAGEVGFGLTDTDDAHGAMLDGKPVAVIAPDAAKGVVLIPNTVSIVRDGPNPEAARKLMDYLLSKEVEQALARARSAQIPLGTDLRSFETPWNDVIAQAPHMPLSSDSPSAHRKAMRELLRRVGMDE